MTVKYSEEFKNVIQISLFPLFRLDRVYVTRLQTEGNKNMYVREHTRRYEPCEMHLDIKGSSIPRSKAETIASD